MSAREISQVIDLVGLAPPEGDGEVRVEDRRRFVRRGTDSTPVRELEQAVAELRERVDGAREIRTELIAAREIVAALRAELAAAQAELAAERVASRRARMQAAWLEGELARREEGERGLREALATMTSILGIGAPGPPDGSALARERAARERLESELATVRGELASLREPAAADEDAVASLRDALAELSGQRPAPSEELQELDRLGAGLTAAAERLRSASGRSAAAGRVASDLPALEARGLAEAAGPWLRDGLLDMARRDPARAERLFVALLAAQAGCAAEPISYGVEIDDGGSYRVSVMGQGAAVGALSPIALDGLIGGSLESLIPLATGGGTNRLAGARVRGRRRLRPLLRARRRPLQLSELALLLNPVPVRELLDVALLAIDPARIERELTVDVTSGAEHLRVTCAPGLRPTLGGPGERAADATLTAPPERLAAVLAGTERVSVDGDPAAAATLLALIDGAR